MKLKTATCVYCSPTGTTRKTLQAIATGMAVDGLQKINLTLPKNRDRPLPPVEGDVLIVGMPVYEEHLPPFALASLKQIQGHGQPAVAVALYGNVGYGVALKEEARILEERGFPVIAGASFVGEHSFAHEALPIALGRPDDRDLQTARRFGSQIRAKLEGITQAGSPPSVELPGRLPLLARIVPENSASRFTHTPHARVNDCTGCGICAKVCPVEAIDEVTFQVDEHKCVRCFACVRTCPESARRIRLRKQWLVHRVLHKAVTHRTEPEVFLS